MGVIHGLIVEERRLSKIVSLRQLIETGQIISTRLAALMLLVF